MSKPGKIFLSQEPIPAAGTASDPSVETPLSGRWVRALFQDLYGRAPRRLEREEWTGQGLDAFLDCAFGDSAVWRHWLDEQLYYFMLIDRFEPVGTTLDELPELLSQRRMAPSHALHRIGLCTNFSQRNPGADTFVTVVMEQYCGIEVHRAKAELEIGKKAYDGDPGTFLGRRASTQADVLRVAATHVEAARHFVDRDHMRLCRAPLKRAAVKRTGRRVHKDPALMFEVYREWFHSPAYGERVARGAPLTNRGWVESVYVDLGDTLAPDDDVEALRGALDSLGDPMPLRSLIVRMLMDEDGTRVPRLPAIKDPEAWLFDTFSTLLGRTPSELEATTFLEICTSGPDGPELVVYALLTSEEYQLS